MSTPDFPPRSIFCRCPALTSTPAREKAKRQKGSPGREGLPFCFAEVCGGRNRKISNYARCLRLRSTTRAAPSMAVRPSRDTYSVMPPSAVRALLMVNL